MTWPPSAAGRRNLVPAPLSAKRRVKAILAVLRCLKTMPCLYTPGDEPGTRQAFCEGHVVVYEVDPDTLDNGTAGDVLVLRVFAPGQDRR